MSCEVLGAAIMRTMARVYEVQTSRHRRTCRHGRVKQSSVVVQDTWGGGSDDNRRWGAREQEKAAIRSGANGNYLPGCRCRVAGWEYSQSAGVTVGAPFYGCWRYSDGHVGTKTRARIAFHADQPISWRPNNRQTVPKDNTRDLFLMHLISLLHFFLHLKTGCPYTLIQSG